MGPGPRVTAQDRLQENIEEAAATFFEPKLRALSLAVDQIEKQSLPQLEESLVRITDAMQHPEQFGTLRMKVTANAAVIISAATSEAQIEIGILPVLLERKSLILDRIKLVRPENQILNLRQQVLDKVDDPRTQEQLLQVLDKQQQEQQQISERIEKETRQLDEEMEAEEQSTRNAIAFAKLEMRVDALDKSLDTRIEVFKETISKLENNAISRWEIATIVFAILASLGGLTGLVLGLIKWLG
jgi:hypothetical protein